MKKIVCLKHFFCFLVATLLFAGCGDDTTGNGGGVENKDLYPKEGYTIMGVVSCEGKGVAGVAVSDGTNVTKTDEYGRYWLPSNISHHEFNFVHISIPSGYEPVERKGIASAYWTLIDKNAAEPQVINFTLKQVNQADYTLMVIADSHVLGGHGKFQADDDRKQYTEKFLPKWKSYAAECAAKGPVYGVHAGDMTQSEAWAKYSIADFRDDTTCEVPIFCALGNHDHENPKDVGLAAASDETQYLTRKSYTAALGPAYYSFNIGTEHYVVLDNTFIETNNSGGYVNKLDSRQLAWLRKDIQAIDKRTIKGVVVVQHIPMFSGNGSVAMENGERVMDILKDYPLTFLIGHSHLDRTVQSETSAGNQVLEYIHPSLAGTAWFTLCNTEGTPAAFCAYDFENGKSVKRTYVPFGENENVKYRIYSSVANSGICDAWSYPITERTGKRWSIELDQEVAKPDDRAAILVNWWGATRIEVTGEGTISTPGIYDLTYRDWFWPALESGGIGKNADGSGASWQRPSKNSTHIWQYIPDNATVPVMLDAYDACNNRLGRVMISAK